MERETIHAYFSSSFSTIVPGKLLDVLDHRSTRRGKLQGRVTVQKHEERYEIFLTVVRGFEKMRPCGGVRRGAIVMQSGFSLIGSSDEIFRMVGRYEKARTQQLHDP
ncbi:MAG: hypothetical protein ACRC56_04930 [Bosea sp. (in: a-proteobacteria)]